MYLCIIASHFHFFLIKVVIQIEMVLQDELLKIVGTKHPSYGISTKCSYILFNKDYVKDIFLEVDLYKQTTNSVVHEYACDPCTEKDLIHLLEDENEIIKEGVLHVVAKAGGAIRDQLGESFGTLNLILERICEQISRRQAKSIKKFPDNSKKFKELAAL
ncbi:hypothetical protein LXL04_017770 [Taraxacum kok-saghyz]